MEYLFDLLKMKPVLSIILGFVLAIFILIFFKDLIISYIKKKYNLYSEQEVVRLFNNYYNRNIASDMFEDKLDDVELIKYLRNERLNQKVSSLL